MSHVYDNDTLLIIDIQADNRAEILQVVHESFEYMPGWTFGDSASNAKVNHPDARFFCFNLSIHVFDWWRTNDSYADTMDEDDVVVKDIADISNLLEFVYLNGESLRPKVNMCAEFEKFFAAGNPPPPKKRKKANEPLPSKLNMEKLEKKLKEFQTKPDFNPMMFIEEMPQPKANVYYKDFAPKDLTPEQYDTYYDKALHATCEGELIGLYNKTAGLHGPLATKLGHFINQKIKNLKYPPKTSWAAADVATEIDKEVLAKILMEYEKFTKEAQAKKTQAWYTEASYQSKPWSKKWHYTPHSDKIVKTSMPYNYSGVYPTDSMDY